MIGLIYIVLGHWILGWSVDDARVRGGVTVWSVCVCVCVLAFVYGCVLTFKQLPTRPMYIYIIMYVGVYV